MKETTVIIANKKYNVSVSAIKEDVYSDWANNLNICHITSFQIYICPFELTYFERSSFNSC